MTDPETIIIGSGPAGCSTALHLVAQSPAWRDRILVLEAKHHPRAKLCGGGVTVFGLLVLRGLGLTLDAPHVEVNEAHIRFQRRALEVRGQPLLAVVDRASLDAWLVREVRARGVCVEEDSPVRAVEPTSSEVTVHTAARAYHPKAVVLACGSRGLDLVAWRGGPPSGRSALRGLSSPLPHKSPPKESAARHRSSSISLRWREGATVTRGGSPCRAARGPSTTWVCSIRECTLPAARPISNPGSRSMPGARA